MKFLKLTIILHLFLAHFSFSQIDKAPLITAKNHLLQGNYQACQKVLFPTFLEIRKTQGENTADYQEALSLLADLITKMGYYTLAERITLKELSQVTRLYGRSDARTVNSYIRLGDIATFKTDYSNATVRYEQAYDMAATLKDNELLIADIQLHQGQLSTEKGEYTAAEALLRRTNTVYQKKGIAQADIRYIALKQAYANLFFALRNYTKAVQLLEHNLFYLRKNYHSSHPKIAENHQLLAAIYLKAAGQNATLKEKGQLHLDSAKSQTYLTPALYLSQQKQQAELLRQSKNFAKADTIYRQLLESSGEITGEHSRLKMDFMLEEAQMYYQMGNMDECLALYERIEDMQKEYLSITHPDYLKTLQNLSIVHWATGNYKKAHRYFLSSSESLLEQFQRATSFMSEQEKGLFYEDSRRFFDRFNAYILANYLQHTALSREMYDYQLQTKAMLFSSAVTLREKVFATQDSALINFYFKWLGGKEQLAKIYKLTNEGLDVSSQMLDSLENTLNDLEKSIQLKVTLTDNRQGIENERITSAKLRQKLAPDEAAIEIIRVESFNPQNGGHQGDTIYYAALILTPKMPNPELVLFNNGKQLENQYAKFYKNALLFRLKDTVSYQRFWKRIAESASLKNVKKIYLSVDGVFNKININTLKNPQTGKYLVEEVDIHLLTNTKDIYSIKLSKNNPTIPNQALLMGYPNYNDSRANGLNINTSAQADAAASPIADLPGTKTEIDDIGKLLDENKKQTATFFSSEANEGNFKQKAPQNGLLHIATHGFFSAPNTSNSGFVLENERHENPLLRCGILLSGAANAYSKETLQSELKALLSGKKLEDGILTAYEAMNLDLSKTNLVVLSACETGLGEVKNGEGVYGFQRALQTAGAKAIIMSLWKVSDETTISLMTHFYEQWIKLGDKRAAFRAAQNRLRQDFASPYFWGAFIMIGE